MPQVAVYIACSLDGYIATVEHGLGWLTRYDSPEEDYGYGAFYASVDALLIGRTTYEQIPRLGPWPYAEKPCWVFAHEPLTIEQPGVIRTEHSPKAVLQEIEKRGLKRVWLVGGGKLIAAFREQHFITEYIITTVPVLLGQGIPLFVAPGPAESLRLVASHTYANGLVQTHYLPGGQA